MTVADDRESSGDLFNSEQVEVPDLELGLGLKFKGENRASLLSQLTITYTQSEFLTRFSIKFLG